MRETWQGLFIQILPYSLSSEIRMLLSSSYREGTSHRRVLGLQGKVRKSFLDTSLLRFFLLERFSKPKYHILGVACPEFHFYKVVSLFQLNPKEAS